MNLVQKIILAITIPLVILLLAQGLMLNVAGAQGQVACPMAGPYGWGHMGSYSGGWGPYNGIILAVAMLLIGLFEFWLFRDRPKLTSSQLEQE